MNDEAMNDEAMKKVAVAEIGAVLSAIRNAAALVGDADGGYTKIHFEHDGANYERAWTVTLHATANGRTMKAQGKSFEACVAELTNQVEGALRTREEKFRRDAEAARAYLKRARGETS